MALRAGTSPGFLLEVAGVVGFAQLPDTEGAFMCQAATAIQHPRAGQKHTPKKNTHPQEERTLQRRTHAPKTNSTLNTKEDHSMQIGLQHCVFKDAPHKDTCRLF